ncbi:MAG TPA: hypothetical protein PKH65_06700 [Bacteroidia bacterium]|nr:hypothetical protein [Bacteroidia bacterium]HNT80357.1 hypothetical protein [Bacteroidia bacterium]
MSVIQAVVDCGSNTFHLIVFEKNSSGFKILHKQSDFVWLGRNLSNQKRISSESFNNGVEKLIEYKSKIDEFKVSEFVAYGTAALRMATNGVEFVKKAFEQSSIKIQIIEGVREAELIYTGVKNIIPITNTSLIIDIGGASTEFILCNSEGIIKMESFALGGNILIEKTNASNPVSHQNIIDLHALISEDLNSFLSEMKQLKPACIIGCSGSFTTYVEVLHAEYQQAKKGSNNGYTQIDFEHFNLLYNRLINASLDEIYALKGMNPKRAPLIAVASVLTKFIIDQLNIKEIVHSPYALKEGAMFEFLQQ